MERGAAACIPQIRQRLAVQDDCQQLVIPVLRCPVQKSLAALRMHPQPTSLSSTLLGNTMHYSTCDQSGGCTYGATAVSTLVS